MRKILLPVITIFFFSVATGQISNRCGSNEMIKQQMAKDPAYAKKVEELLKNKGHYGNNQKGRPENPGKPPAPPFDNNSCCSSCSL